MFFVLPFQGSPCSQCGVTGPNLWICLQRGCQHIGCSEYLKDHDTQHFNTNPLHCIHMNLSSQRIWCYICETEVFLPNSMAREIPSDVLANMNRYMERAIGGGFNGAFPLGNSGADDSQFVGDDSVESSADDDFDGDGHLTGGLVGLQNIANTCYMNAALQALSNTPALTGYFLECGVIMDPNNDVQRKTGLAKSYHRLVKEMWLSHGRKNGELHELYFFSVFVLSF